MAVMQTPHGRVIGLILPAEDQPMKEAVEDKKASAPVSSAQAGSAPSKTAAKRGTRTAKK
ncbi:MAG: hypothetical protein IJH25_06240 [Clostridia bacterium]|nr:hypothetical protein [Clostridia bacterium]